MKKLLCILFSFLFFICNAHTAQIVNVEYIHNLISQEWDITVPYNPALSNVKSIANMKYLLTAIDVANEILNGEKTTNYGNGEFATTRIADTIATNQAVETLVKQNKIEYKFSATIDLSHYDDNNGFGWGWDPVTEFGFSISAAGTFYIDWGDGTVETIKKDNTEYIEYTHDYGTSDGVYTIQIGGRATDYSDNESRAAIDFQNTFGAMSGSYQALTDINGSLGAIFGTLSNGKQPRFFYTFASTYGLKKIPENLFDGIYGDLVDGMFVGTFMECGGLTGPSARINGKYLYEIWPDATTNQVDYMYEYSTRLDDYACIPYAWGGGGALGEECDSSSNTPSAPEDAVYDFYLTTTSDTSVFEMQISAAGEFYIDWGDGKTEWITKSDTTNMTYGHQYASKGAYNIRLGGQATAYSTTTAAISFYVNSSQTKIASIDGSLGAIFGTLSSDTNNQPKFYHTFYNATNMKGSIPSDLFAGISGAPASNMFYYTFYGCSGLTGAIPDGLFAGISGAPASYMFDSTFSGCSGLTGAIPENLFAGISGAPALWMFDSTFSGCSGLTSIPSDLFAGISGAPAYYMFDSTFSGCSGLTGSIPEDLFAGISGAPESGMFSDTFSGCSGLTGSIPEDLFAGISGAPENGMFSDTFSGCSGLTGAIPENLFAGISGAPALWMFDGTFSGCSGLTSIPENLFGNISGKAQFSMFSRTFYNCGLLTGPSARINGKYLYEIWPDATTDQVGDMYYHAKKLDDYRCIPTVWGGGGENCSAPTAEFTLTTMPDARDFSFYISAAGEFTVDWGDGTIETINKTDTDNETYHHAYGTAGAYTIGLSGQATAYNPSDIVAAISFNTSSVYNTQKIASIDGSLGAIFGTLSSGTQKQPRFYETFSGASNMTGSIPEKLFAGISGAPAVNMFRYTFYNCTSLTGPSARIDGQYLYEIWPDLSNGYVGAMYYNATGLSDYSLIPSVYKEEEGGLEI